MGYTIEPLYKSTIEKTINCPQCGDKLDIYFKWTKLVACSSCKSSIFLEDDGSINIGEASSLSPEPSLLELHKPIQIEDKDFLPIGKIRYSYGRGFWEEWFLQDKQNQEFWLSIDEGDFVLQQKSTITLPFKNPLAVKVGRAYGKYIVTEKGTAKCVGFEGELPEKVKIGESHIYLHLSEGRGKLLTLESTGTRTQTFTGQWIDPLTIKSIYS